MDRWFHETNGKKLLWVHCCNLFCIKMPKALLQCPWAVECPFHRNLLIEQHANEKGSAVAIQKGI